MKYVLRIGIPVVTLVLLVVGTLHPERTTSIIYIAGEGTGAFASSRSPEAVIEAVMQNVKMHRYHDAFRYVANIDQVDEKDFTADMHGTSGSLRAYSGLEDFDFHVLRNNGAEAVVRTTMHWSTSLGEFSDTRDLKIVKDAGAWKVVWPEVRQAKVAPQIVPVNYQAWNVIWHGEQFSGPNAQKPRVRAMNVKALTHGNATVVLGELVNDDSVPALVFVEASLVGHNGADIAQESSYETMSHVLLPSQSTPFRVDFAGIRLTDVKTVRITPESSLVQASTDPVITVQNQHDGVDALGRHILAGDLMNQSGRIVNIPHVIAACYDAHGQIVWVSQGYVDKPLLPQTTVPFAVNIPDDIVSQVKNYRITVNQFSSSIDY